MTKNEEIKKVIFGLQFLKEKLYNGIFSDRLDCIDYAISAIKELQMYKDNKLCLVPEDVYSRQCCELDAYKEIGTVEEFREAMEKQNPKKCIIDSCPDHTHYKCPSCGQIELSIYKHGFPRLGRITKYCENCGQALIDEN